MNPETLVIVGAFALIITIYLAVIGGGLYIAYLVIVALKKYIIVALKKYIGALKKYIGA